MRKTTEALEDIRCHTLQLAKAYPILIRHATARPHNFCFFFDPWNAASGTDSHLNAGSLLDRCRASGSAYHKVGARPAGCNDNFNDVCEPMEGKSCIASIIRQATQRGDLDLRRQLMSRVLGTILLLLMAAPAGAALRGEEVSYRDGDTVMKGYLVYDDRFKGPRAAVLVVHEWWGHNRHARESARRLARLGYTALAVDMYGDGKNASHPADAGALSGAVRKNMAVAQSRFMAAYRLLAAHATVDGRRIGAIGYCFGGGIVLEMARRGVDLKAVASFHGSLAITTPAQQGTIRAAVLVMNGADDPFTKAEQIAAIKTEMKAAGVDFRFVEYPGARHAFTNPDATVNGKKFNLPLANNKEADRRSWAEMKKFMARTLK